MTRSLLKAFYSESQKDRNLQVSESYLTGVFQKNSSCSVLYLWLSTVSMWLISLKLCMDPEIVLEIDVI